MAFGNNLDEKIDDFIEDVGKTFNKNFKMKSVKISY